jgi:hypothetical protein
MPQLLPTFALDVCAGADGKQEYDDKRAKVEERGHPFTRARALQGGAVERDGEWRRCTAGPPPLLPGGLAGALARLAAPLPSPQSAAERLARAPSPSAAGDPHSPRSITLQVPSQVCVQGCQRESEQ